MTPQELFPEQNGQAVHAPQTERAKAPVGSSNASALRENKSSAEASKSSADNRPKTERLSKVRVIYDYVKKNGMNHMLALLSLAELAADFDEDTEVDDKDITLIDDFFTESYAAAGEVTEKSVKKHRGKQVTILVRELAELGVNKKKMDGITALLNSLAYDTDMIKVAVKAISEVEMRKAD